MMNRKQRRIAGATANRAGVSPSSSHVADLFAAGLAHHQLGQLAKAEALYRQTLVLRPNHADALHLLGVIASQAGRHEVAVDLILQAISYDRFDPVYHSNLGLAFANLRRLDEALESYGRALSLRPSSADVHYNRGNALLALGRPHEALEAYEQAIRVKPDYAEALTNHGAALASLERNDEALASYDRALAVVPDFSAALSNRGNALKALGRCAEALESYNQALKASPADAEALVNRGVTLHELKCFDAALESYDRALEVRPDHVEALLNRGAAFREIGRLEDALASYDQVLALRPGYVEALSNRGTVLNALGRFGDALASYDVALRLRPDDPALLSNRTVALLALDRLDEALATCNRALAFGPDSAEPLNNRASVLQELRRFDEALVDYDRAIAIAPDYAQAHMNRALMLLLTDNFAEGWPAYEWRRKLRSWDDRGFPQPEWSGEDIAGRRLLLHAEQGFGDTIQFARYARLMVARGADVILEVQPTLKPLLDGLFGVRVVAAGRDQLPPFDLHCPLLSLPHLLATTLATIPGGVPYVAAPAHRIAAWARRLPKDGLRVGVAWSGHPDSTRDNERSIPFARLAPLMHVPGTHFISLQKEIRSADADDFYRCDNIIDFSADLRDFADTAAVIAQLDLVITVDTAIAHLTGAIGKPLWLLLPRVPDFRWLLDRATSPWYPTARLFRKGQVDTWDAVIARVAMELSRMALPTKRAQSV